MVKSPSFGNQASARTPVFVSELCPKYTTRAKPWISIENATTDELRDQVRQCPSGALSLKGQ